MWQTMMAVCSLSCKSILALDLIQPRSRLDYLPPRASLITSKQDHPKKTKQVPAPVQIHSSKQMSTQSHSQAEASMPSNVQDSPRTRIEQQRSHKKITSKEFIMKHYPDVFEGIGKFLGPPYTIHLDPSLQPKQTPCRPVPIHPKETFKQEIDKMLQTSVLKPVTKATHWINSFVLVESKDKSGNHKLRICLDPTNLNKAIIRKPYHFKTPEDTAHLIARACTLTVLDCHKGYWHQQLDEQSSYMTTFNTRV